MAEGTETYFMGRLALVIKVFYQYRNEEAILLLIYGITNVWADQGVISWDY